MGANVSKSSSTITSNLKSSIETSQKSMVNTSTSVSCSNIQEVVGVSGCSVNFAEQDCSLDAVTRSTSNMSVLNSVSQDVIQSLKNSAAAESSGLPVGINSSNASAFVKSMVDVSQKAAQALGTNCSRNASAVNIQSFRDSSCDEKNVINFAAQSTSLSLMSECVVTQMASNSSTQKVTSTIDNASSATSKGLDMFAIFGIFILVLGFMLFFPILKRFITGIGSSPAAQKAAELPASLPPDVRKDIEDRRNAKSTLSYLLLGLVFMVLVIWPGMISGLLHIFPWPSKLPTFDGQQTCRKDGNGGGFVNEADIVNKFGFTDTMCTTGDKNQQDCKTIVSYKECGVFSGLCDDPEYIKARADYDKAIKACGALENSPFEYCRPQDISNVLFADSYPGCSRCVDDPSSSTWHTHVAEGKSCDPSTVNLYYYMGTNDQRCPGGAELGYCFDTKEALKAKSPNECLDAGYQIRKKQLSQYLRSCDAMKATSRSKSDVISESCPPPMFSYFTKCSKDTYKCNYIANGCVCDSTGKNCDCRAADKSAVGACQNDFTGCLDPDYIKDVKFHESINATCEEFRQQETQTNYVVAVVFGSLYIIMILAMIYFAYFSFRTQTPETRQAYTEQTRRIKAVQENEQLMSKGRYKFLLGLLLVLLFVFIPPTGLMAIGGRMAPLWTEQNMKNNKYFDGIEKIDQTGLTIGGGIGTALCLIAIIFCLFKLAARVPPPTTGRR